MNTTKKKSIFETSKFFFGTDSKINFLQRQILELQQLHTFHKKLGIEVKSLCVGLDGGISVFETKDRSLGKIYIKFNL